MESGGGKASKNAAEEGHLLLGSPTYEDIGNGRLRCVESGHELPAKEAEAYGRSKACRLSLIDAALVGKKPPLNMFKVDPLCKSKLVCKLTGDCVNKTEEHIWKHISGRRFINKLNQKEQEKTSGIASHQKKEKKSHKNLDKAGIQRDKKKKLNKEITETVPVPNEGDPEEFDFWIPPTGDRWDFDDGKDRWACSGSDVGSDDDIEEDDAATNGKDDDVDSSDLSARAKRLSIAVGPSSFASRKKKSRKSTED